MLSACACLGASPLLQESTLALLHQTHISNGQC